MLPQILNGEKKSYNESFPNSPDHSGPALGLVFLRLFSNIRENTTIHIKNMSIYEIGCLRRKEHCRSLQILHGTPSRCRCLRNNELVKRMAGAVSLSFS